MENMLSAKNLSKQYAKRQALADVSLEVPSGQIIGLLGPNGSGKTTLMKVIAGLLQPDTGDIVYPRGARRGVEAKGVVSFLPDQMDFPSWMRVSDAFRFYQDVYMDFDSGRAADMSTMLGLNHQDHIRKLSKGMKERLSLALTFSRKAPLYLLDEPLGGIDPVGKMQVLDSILSMQLGESSIILSTHLVKDVETIFDSIVLIAEGKVVYQNDCETIREQEGKTVEQVYLEVFRYGQAV